MRLGIDLLPPDGLARLTGRGWFLDYVFAASELAEAAALTGTRRAEFLAGRFGAKEAVLKVLGAGLFDGVAPRDIEVSRAPGGAPRVDLRCTAADAARRAGIQHLTVSITHTRDMVAVVAAGW